MQRNRPLFVAQFVWETGGVDLGMSDAIVAGDPVLHVDGNASLLGELTLCTFLPWEASATMHTDARPFIPG